MKTVVVIGGGAAGYFAAITCAKKNPDVHVILLEKTLAPLAKVRISGGGRCNVTHACFDPQALVKNYPRGSKELLGPFMRFQPRDTIAWFESHHVHLKTEEDGRMFPVTDSSQTIVDCLQKAAKQAGVDVRLQQRVDSIVKEGETFTIILASGEPLSCQSLLLATGSSPQGHSWAQSLGHTISPAVPSLFTFNIPTSPLLDLSGITVDVVRVTIADTSLQQKGSLLLTHWGFSGPAALKLSAWGARLLYDANYRVKLVIDWLPGLGMQEKIDLMLRCKKENPSQNWGACVPEGLPKNLWKRLLEVYGKDPQQRMADVSAKHLHDVAQRLHADPYLVEGKTTYKQEFVTCGGVCLREVNFKTMESKCCPGLYFAGEILDIDGVTGGFNFQAAWTTGWLAGQAMG